jgi:peptidoglycan/LPS O-acetylase OafA/YrhL
VIYHVLGFAWLQLALPAMGVMFGLGGALFVRSATRRRPGEVLARRALRLLVPLWFYALVALLVGWETFGHSPAELARLVFWILPLRDPRQGASTGLIDTLWYVRAYLWFLLISPLALPLVRRWPATTIATPLAALPVAVDLLHRLHSSGAIWIIDLLTYGPCWIIGFLEADDALATVSVLAIAIIAAVGGLVGLTMNVFLSGLARPFDGLGQLGYAIWSAAVVVALLRWRPDTSRLLRRRWVCAPVTFANARALTIYLWHDVAIVAVAAALAATGLAARGALRVVLVMVLTALIAIAVGWVEDLGAVRSPQLLPGRTAGRENAKARRHLRPDNQRLL